MNKMLPVNWLDQKIPQIIRFTYWLRDHPYDMKSCQPNVFITLDDGSRHPARKNILSAHSKYFKILLSLDPEQEEYQIIGFSRESFEIFLDFAYKRTLTKLTIWNQNETIELANFLQAESLIRAIDNYFNHGFSRGVAPGKHAPK